VRTITAPLSTAQRAPVRKPYVAVTISDRFGGIRRLRVTEVYTGSEAAGPHAAASPTDGGLIRLRIEGTTLYRQRDITDGYSVWTSFRTNTRLCALAVYSANLVAFAVDSATPTQVYTATSADNGATWSAFALAFTHTESVDVLAACAKANGDLCAVMESGNNVAARRYTGGAWAAAVVSSDGLVTPTGLAVFHHGDFNTVITGAIVTGGGSRLATRIYGDGYSQPANTWGSARSIADTAPASAVAYSAPFAARPDVSRMTVRETFTGTGAYDRIMTAYSPATPDYVSNLWREPSPFNLDHDYGLAIAYNATSFYLTTPSRVYSALLAFASATVTPDVVAIDYPDVHLGTAPTVVAIINRNNAYGTPAAAPEPVTIGAEVRIAPGYYDANDNALSSAGPAVWVESLEYDYSAPSQGTLRLHCRPMWHWLRAWRAPRAINYASRSPFQILQDLFARAGFELSSLGASNEATIAIPSHIIPAGQDGLSAARLLLARVPDVILTRGEFAFLTEPLASEASDAAYARGDAAKHTILAASYRQDAKPATHVRVVGGPAANIVGESIDFAEGPLHASAPALTADRNLTTAADALDRATAISRLHTIASRSDAIRTPVHAGLELHDVIDITDARAGLSAAKRRVTALRMTYERRPGRVGKFDHAVALGAP